MNREIKFRAWDGHKMIYQESINGEDIIDYDISVVVGFDNHAYLLKEDEHGNKTIIESGNLLPLEYTGLKDKVLNYIYKGDITKQPSSNGTVEQMAYGVIKENKGCYYIDYGGGFWVHGMLLYHFNQCEVIGNIYQNPELLESIGK